MSNLNIDTKSFMDMLDRYNLFRSVGDHGQFIELKLELDECSGCERTFYLGKGNLIQDLDRVMEVIYNTRHEIAGEYTLKDGCSSDIDVYLYEIGLMFDRYRQFERELSEEG